MEDQEKKVPQFKLIGFLAPDEFGFAEYLRQNLGRHIEICLKINNIAQLFQYQINANTLNVKHLISSVLYARILSTFQAAILLGYRGMNYQMVMLYRSILDYLYPLVAISMNPGFETEFSNSDLYNDLKMMNKLKNHFLRIKMHDQIPIVEQRIADIKKQIEETGAREVSIYDCAVKSGMIDHYDIIYSSASNVIHPSVRNLEDNFIFDNNEERSKILAIKNEPDIKDMDHSYSVMVKAIAQAMEAAGNIFEIAIPKLVNECCEQIEAAEKDFLAAEEDGD